jgi:hypothetical protein
MMADSNGRLALVFVDFAALAGGLGFLLLGHLPWSWLKTWWPTKHIHACSVIANQVIFDRRSGPKSLSCRSRFMCWLSRSPGVRFARSQHPPISSRCSCDPSHHPDYHDADFDRRLGRARGDDDGRVRLRRAGSNGRNGGFDFVRRGVVHRRLRRRPGLDLQRGKDRQYFRSDAASGLSNAEWPAARSQTATGTQAVSRNGYAAMGERAISS